MEALVRAARELRREVDQLKFARPVAWVYNPLDYAWPAHREYLQRYARPTCEVLLLGMNPGPWGMAQTGVPFGEIAAVRDWLGIQATIHKPLREHPARRVEGWDCSRSEVSGRRLWGLFQQRFRSPDKFAQQHFVANYCPLLFLEDSGRNLTPDKLKGGAVDQLLAACDAHLKRQIELLEPGWVIGVGAFAERRARRVVADCGVWQPTVRVGRILHPSPASPAANRDWAGAATRQLQELGVW